MQPILHEPANYVRVVRNLEYEAASFIVQGRYLSRGDPRRVFFPHVDGFRGHATL
jgi:hypothetical protein